MRTSLRTTTVFVGLSGGVDSSVAAARLVDAGYDVVGVFIEVWQPDFLECNWEAERLDAMRVAAHLGIPFLTCDARDRYKRDVVDYLVDEYRAGRTPNPDVMCNTHVKFGAFLDFADAHGAAYIATGHYAQRVQHGSTYELHRGADAAKDQSYFLWTLTEAQLARSLFPIGDTDKAAVRREAHARGLPTAAKPDSQGICFLGTLDMRAFLEHFIEPRRGSVHTTDGEQIGTHEGAWFYTIGQRHGFRITRTTSESAPYYVVHKDIDRNTITVSHEKPVLPPHTRALTLGTTNWIGEVPEGGADVQIRYRQTPVAGTLTRTGDGATVLLADECDTPALGQSCVLYRTSRCLGGGRIVSVG